MAEPKKRQLRVLTELSASEFQHPQDARATGALRKVPGLDRVLAKVMEYGLERVYYLETLGSCVRVTDTMFARLHRGLRWACRILDMPEPLLFVATDPVPNAFAYGHTNPFIVLTSGLIDMLDDEERLFVIGHELGHIKSEHVLYTLMAENISAIVQLVGQATLGIGALLGQGLVYALYEWYRSSELTCDRAGLLCVQDFEPCVRTFMKLSGGARSLYDEMNRDAFMDQIRSYDEGDDSNLDRAYKILLTARRTHPFAILRAKELDAWFRDGGYDTLISARRPAV